MARSVTYVLYHVNLNGTIFYTIIWIYNFLFALCTNMRCLSNGNYGSMNRKYTGFHISYLKKNACRVYSIVRGYYYTICSQPNHSIDLILPEIILRNVKSIFILATHLLSFYNKNVKAWPCTAVSVILCFRYLSIIISALCFWFP